MRIFYTGSDMEDLAASGVRQLEVGSGVALTDSARELAEELGIQLVVAGSAPASKAAAPAPAAPAKSGALPARPRGCQHGPLGAAAGPASSTAPAGSNQVVEQLVDAVSALKKRGG